MKFTPELLTKAKETKSAEELLALAKENDIELTAEEAEQYFGTLHPADGELSDDELDNVSGGGCGDDDDDVEVGFRFAYNVGDRVLFYDEVDSEGRGDPNGRIIEGTISERRWYYYLTEPHYKPYYVIWFNMDWRNQGSICTEENIIRRM